MSPVSVGMRGAKTFGRRRQATPVHTHFITRFEELGRMDSTGAAGLRPADDMVRRQAVIEPTGSAGDEGVIRKLEEEMLSVLRKVLVFPFLMAGVGLLAIAVVIGGLFPIRD